MPRFVSDQGEWHPADMAAEAELKLKGVKTLGIKAQPKQPNPVMAEAQNEYPKASGEEKFPEIRKRGTKKEKK